MFNGILSRFCPAFSPHFNRRPRALLAAFGAAVLLVMLPSECLAVAGPESEPTEKPSDAMRIDPNAPPALRVISSDGATLTDASTPDALRAACGGYGLVAYAATGRPVGHTWLLDPAFWKELGVSPEQEKKLRVIAAMYETEEAKFCRDLLYSFGLVRQRSRLVELDQKLLARRESQAKVVRGRIEAILTPGQLDAYKNRRFPSMAFDVADLPDAYKTLGIAGKQREAMGQLATDLHRRTEEETQRQNDRLLAMLNVSQRQRLAAEVAQRYREGLGVEDEMGSTLQTGSPSFAGTPADGTSESYIGILAPADSTSVSRIGGTITIDFAASITVGGTALASLPLPVYGWLSVAKVRQQLGIADAQQRQLTEIADKFHADREKLVQALERLRAANRQRYEFARFDEDKFLRKEVRRRIEALLTPQQLASLKDIMLRSMAIDVLGWSPVVEEKIGLSDQQKAAVKDAVHAKKEATDRVTREMYEKLLALLTPKQRATLRQELDRRVWSGER